MNCEYCMPICGEKVMLFRVRGKFRLNFVLHVSSTSRIKLKNLNTMAAQVIKVAKVFVFGVATNRLKSFKRRPNEYVMLQG